MHEITLTVDETEERYIDELLGAMRAKCEAEISEESEILTPRFERDFRATLLINHCFLQSPLATDSFEAAFVRAASAAGHKVERAPEGQRFWDVAVNGRRISLKSTAAANLRIGTLHISKLCEAAWIQDMRAAAQREQATKHLFVDYTSTVDSIVQLRLFKKKSLYELVEIPGDLLAQVMDVPRSEFSADGPSINIPVGSNPPDFTLKLDRSDAKITIANINKNKCNVLGVWAVDC